MGFLPKQLELELKQRSWIQGFPSLEAMISLSEDRAELMACSSPTPSITTSNHLHMGWDSDQEREAVGKKLTILKVCFVPGKAQLRAGRYYLLYS